jgi:hypothetical protein
MGPSSSGPGRGRRLRLPIVGPTDERAAGRFRY